MSTERDGNSGGKTSVAARSAASNRGDGASAQHPAAVEVSVDGQERSSQAGDDLVFPASGTQAPSLHEPAQIHAGSTRTLRAGRSPRPAPSRSTCTACFSARLTTSSSSTGAA